LRKTVAIGIIVALMLLMASSTSAGYIIEDNKVYVEGTWGKLEVYPHTIHSSGWVYFNITPYQDFGALDFCWGFNTSRVKPKKAEFYQPHYVNWTTNHSLFLYNVSSFSATTEACEYGNEYNTYKYNVTYQICSRYNETTGECEAYNTTSSIVCIDSYKQSGNNYTIYWHTKHSKLILWKDISAAFKKINYEHGGMNTWYYIKNISLEVHKTYQVRAWIDVPVSIEGISGKYWWAIKPSSETISQTIANGHFFAIDPWYSASWSHRKQWTVTNVGSTTLTNFPAYINVSHEPEMQSDWDDVVFTDSDGNIIPYELENYTTNYAHYWVNISSLPGGGTYTGYIYYGNDAATSQENPEGVWDSSYKMVHHFQDFEDSTSNNNDGTNYGSTYNDSGRVDGSRDFDGVNDYVDCGNDESLNITDAITIEAWVKLGNLTNSGSLVCKGTCWMSEGLDSYHLWYYNSDGTFRFEIGNGSTREIARVSCTDTNWHHIVGTWDGTTNPNGVKIYMDGVLGEETTATFSEMGSPDLPLYIGKRHYGSPYFNGTIDEVRISSVVRSADWIKQSYEMVVNQSTWVSWGSAEQYPSIPVITGHATYNFGVNFTFTEGSGYPLDTDSFNISWKNSTASGWQNGTTDLFFNHTTQPHGYVAIDVWAYNSTEGKLSEAAASDNVTVPNNAPVITNTSDWQGDEGELVYLNFDCTDADGDTCTFSTNATKGTFNTTTGVFKWQTDMASQGTYTWWFKVEDGWGGEDIYVATIIVNDLYHPVITNWWNNYTANNLTHFTIAAEDDRTVFFNVTANQTDMTWYWYKDGDLVQTGTSNNYTATWDVGGIDKTIAVYGVNPNGQTQTLIWTIYIEYTAHEIEWLKYKEMQKQTEAEEMLGLSALIIVLIVIAFVLFLLGIHTSNSILTFLGTMIFFVTMALPIPVLSNYPYFAIALTGVLFLFGIIGVIITFYQWLTSYRERRSYHKWERYFE